MSLLPIHTPAIGLACLLACLLAAGLTACDNQPAQPHHHGPPTPPPAASAQTQPAPDLANDEPAPPPHLAHPPSDPRAALSDALARGLLADEGPANDKLAKVLRVTGVPRASQVLVFSKTSMQHRLISPTTPRAIYFNDDCYIGHVPGGLTEFGDADTDPEVASGLFAIDLKDANDAALRTDPTCLNCHQSSRTGGHAGFLVRSVFPDADGFPITSAGSTDVGHDTPIHKRWGGWYVTGASGSTHHRGNQTTAELPNGDARLDNALGSNVNDLSPYFNTDRYLVPTSDIVALMVLEHQVVMHNLLTGGSASVRKTMERSKAVADHLGEPFDPAESDTLQRVIASNADRIVRHLLFCDEAALTEPIVGGPSFQAAFRANRRADSRGRSLKDFDLQTRLFEYRCSYMVYSRAFDIMPELLKQAVADRLHEVLTGAEEDPAYAHLPHAERKAIHQILRETTGFY